MDKNFMVFIAIGVGVIYFLINFVGEVQSEDERLHNDAYDEKNRYVEYDGVDSIGQEILDLTGASVEVQIGAWNGSPLKAEYLALFPNFSEMKKFIDDRIRGEGIRAKLLHTVNSVEDKFFSGDMSMEQVKRELRNVQ